VIPFGNLGGQSSVEIPDSRRAFICVHEIRIYTIQHCLGKGNFMTTDPTVNPKQTIKSIKVWLNAFIPRTLSNQTKPVSTGVHLGKTMLIGPTPRGPCFLTDQRSFSNDLEASSRMHSEIEIDLDQRVISREFHHCHPTIEVDAETGEVKCEESAGTEHMKFSNFEISDDARNIQVEIKGSSKNPCLKIVHLKVSPNLDYYGTISIQLDPAHQESQITFNGKIETYPAFEMYASVNNGSPITVFQADVESGKTAVNLIGPPGRDISGEAHLSLPSASSSIRP
jgi:hypothetical protein